MTAKHYYRDVSGTLHDQTAYVLRESWTTRENAEEGSVGSSTITVIDTAMALDYTGHRRWLIREDESESDDDILFSGYTGAQEISRGEGDETFEPLGRVWAIELYDLNTLWSRRVIRNGKRPAETDVERVQWLLGLSELTYWVDNSVDYVQTSGAVAMDKVDYTGQMVNAIMDDCAQQSGKNWFLRHINNGVDDEICAFYGEYTYDSPLALSNDPADLIEADLIDGTSLVWPIAEDTKLKRDPSRVFVGGYLEYEKGRIYRERAATETEFALGGRDMIVPAANVKTKAKAIARVNRALVDASTQDERITTSVRVPKGKATMLKPGMRVNYKATHQPGYEDFRLCRILNASPHPVAAGAYYDIALELQGPGAPGGGGVFAFLSFTNDAVVDVPTIGGVPDPEWTAIADEVGTMTYDNSGQGVIIAEYVGTNPAYIWTHEAAGSPWMTTAGAQLSGIGAGRGTPVGTVDLVLDTSGSIDVVADGPGIILACIRINNFDAGTALLTDPDGFVPFYHLNGKGCATSPAAGSREWGAVSFGYLPVDSAGTYTLTWTMSNQYAGGGGGVWQKLMCGIWVEAADPAIVQLTGGTNSIAQDHADATFPSPL